MGYEDFLLGMSEAERQDAIATAEASKAISGVDANHENTTARQRKLTRVKNAVRKAQSHPVVEKLVEQAIAKSIPQPDAEFTPYMDFQTPDLNSGYFSQEDMGNQVADAVRPLGTDVGEYQAMLTDAQLDASRNISDQYARALRGGQSYEQYRAKLAADYLSGNKRYDTTGEFNDLESLTGVSQMNPNTNVDLPSLMGDILFTGVDSAVGAGELAVGSANWLSQNALQDELNYIKTAREALREQFASDELKAQMANVQNAKMSENPIADTIAELASNPRNAMYLAGSNALTMLPILGAGKLTGQAFKAAPVIADALGMTGRGAQIAETMANLAPQAQRWGGVGADMIANGQEQYNDLISETDANGNRKYTDDEANLAGAITALGTLATHHITGGGLEDIMLREEQQVAKQEAQSGIKGALKTAFEVAEPVISETAEEGLQSLSGTAGRKLVTGEEFTAGDIANAIEEASAGGFSATPHTARNIVSKIANADTTAQQATQNKVVNQNQQNLKDNAVSQPQVTNKAESNDLNEIPQTMRTTDTIESNGINWKDAGNDEESERITESINRIPGQRRGIFRLVNPENDGNRLQGESLLATTAQNRRTRELAEKTKFLEKALGRRIQFVKETSGQESAFGGFILQKTPNTIYVNANTEFSLETIVGHEFYEGVFAKDEDLNRWYSEHFKNHITKEGFSDYVREMRKKGDEQELQLVYKEMLADSFGDALNDENFRNKLAQDNPSMFRKLIKKFVQFLNRMLDRVTKTKSGLLGKKDTGTTSKYIKDVELLRKKMLSVMEIDTASNKNTSNQNGISLIREISGRKSNDWDTHHFSYMEDHGDGLFAVQTEMWTNPTITFKELEQLARTNNGNYSYKEDTQDEYGGIGRFVFETEEDAVNFQDEIEKLGNKKWGAFKTPKEEKFAREEANIKANKEEQEKRKQDRESGTPREQVRHGRNWVASERKEENPLIGKTNRELIDWLGTEKEETIRQWGGDELVEKLQALKDKQDTQEKARQEAVGEWVDEDGVVHTRAENTSKKEQEKTDSVSFEYSSREKDGSAWLVSFDKYARKRAEQTGQKAKDIKFNFLADAYKWGGFNQAGKIAFYSEEEAIAFQNDLEYRITGERKALPNQEETNKDDYDGERLDPEKNPPYEPPYKTDDSPIEKKEPTTDGKSANPVQQEEWVDEDGIIHTGKNPNDLDAHQKMVRDSIGAAKYEEMQQKLIAKYNEAKQAIAEKGSEATEDDFRRLNEARNICKAWGVAEDTLDGKFENTQKDARERRKERIEKRRQAREQQTEKQEKNTETTEEKGDASWQSADENDQPKSKVEEEGQETEDEESFAPENERTEPDPIIDPPPSINAFEVPRETGMKKRWGDFIRRTQDRMRDMKLLQEAVEEATGEEIPDNRNVYLADEVYQARTQEQQRVLRENYENKIYELAEKTKLTGDEISNWLAARHITLDKVNARLARKYGEDNLTGWTDKQALEEYNKHKDNADMQAIGKLMDDMHNHVLDLHMQNNMIDRVSYDNVKNAYKHYVPLRDVDEGFEHVKGTGFSLIGNELKYRKGKKHKETANVLAQAFINSETAVRRIEKTRVGRTLLRFVQSYPNDTFWKVTNRKGENVPENVLVVRDNNAVDQWITFNKADPVAMHVHNALKNLDAKELPKTVQKIGALNNYLGKWITSKNPGFILRNLIRDVPNALLNISATKIKGKQMEVLKTMPQAWMGMRNFIKNGTFADKDGVVNEVDKYVQEFIENGGKTNFVPLDGNVIGRTEQIEKMLKTMENDTPDKRNMFKALGKLIEDTNAIAENVVRLSSFIVARKQGISIPQAVHIARNVSVNFGRRGSDTSWISAFYLFGNASIQGTATLVNTLKKSKRARIVVGAMIGAGFANRMLVQLMFGGLNGGLDDDDTYISQFEKDNYYLVPYKFGDVLDDFVKIPVSHGLKVFHILGGYMADLIFNHKAQRNPLSYGVNALLSAMSDYSPFGQGSIGQALAPTFFQPIIGLMIDNKTGMGGDIVQKGNPDMPAYHNAKYNTEKHWKWLSQAFNYVTGGGDNAGEKGWLQVQPDWIKYAVESYLMPGPITDIDRTFGAVEKLVDRFIKGDSIKPMERKADEITSKDIPVIGSFHGSPWHIWEATNDVNYDDKPKNKADMDDAMERREKRDGSGWGRDGEYHEAKDKVFTDIVNGDRPIVRDNRGIKDDEKSLWTFDNKQIEDTLSRMIGSAKEEIYVASYEMSLPRATEQLIAARQRGVKVNIVVDAKQNRDRASENALTALKNAGCTISESSAYNAMHQKVVIVDGKHSFSGSFNLSQNAVMRNSENATFVFNNTDWANQGAYGIREPFQRSHPWEAKKDYNEETGKKNKYKTKLEIDIARKMGKVNSQAEARYVLDKERRSADRYRGYNDEGKSTKGSREYNALMDSIKARMNK